MGEESGSEKCPKIMTLDALLQQGEQGSLIYYVWPYEGQYRSGIWHFHKGFVFDGGVDVKAPSKPLLVDGPSARAFKLVYDAVNDKNKAKLREYSNSRGLFCWAMDTLVWPHISFGGIT